MRPRLFALDHNFPQPIVDAVAPFLVEAELVPLQRIDTRMAELDDWEVLLALYASERPWDGLITTDSGMLALPKELAVLLQTKLTLVLAEAAGHDPLKATGLILAHLPGICERTRPEIAQLWTLRTSPRPHTDPWQRLTGIANRQGVKAKTLYEAQRLSREELTTDPLR